MTGRNISIIKIVTLAFELTTIAGNRVAKEIEFRDVLELIELIKASSNFSEIRVRSGDLEIELRRGAAVPETGAAQGVASVAPPTHTLAQAPPASPQAPEGPDSAAPAVRATHARAGVHVVCAPMVGTVYRAPQPGAPAFASVGQRVSASDQVCIVEVMKLMNAISAGHAGVVSAVLVDDGQTVQAGQELFVIALA